MFLTTFSPGQKVTTLFVRKLSRPRCVCFHAIRTEVTDGMFFHDFFSGQKLSTVFMHELSALLCVYYHSIYTEFIAGGGGIFFNNYPRDQGHRGVCT